MNQLLTVKDMTQKFKVTPVTIYKWIKEGMPSLKINKARRFDEGAVMDWVNQKNKNTRDSSALVGGDSEN